MDKEQLSRTKKILSLNNRQKKRGGLAKPAN